MLLKSGLDLSSELKNFVQQSERSNVFVPYVKLQSLEELYKDIVTPEVLVVRWDPMDFVSGVSDIEIFDFCKKNNITLYRNPRLHLKAFISNFEKCFLGSANITSKGINIPENPIHNYELATIVDNLSIEDRLYFNIILNESSLITDNIYQQILKQIPEAKARFPKPSKFKIGIEYPDKNFLISSLPMTYDLDILQSIYKEREHPDEVELNCALHDLALYGITFGLSEIDFVERLSVSFFKHPFIIGFLDQLDEKGELYFGEAKAWIQNNCSDVPTPRKWEITSNIQILYRWIERLGDGKYGVDRPNYSERLYLIK